jgi:hypothetical protein
MATIALTLPAYNDLLIQAALAAHWVAPPCHENAREGPDTVRPIGRYRVASEAPSQAPENRGVSSLRDGVFWRARRFDSA